MSISISKELKNLKNDLDRVSSWGYGNSEEVDGGFRFDVKTPEGQTRKVMVLEGTWYDVDFCVETADGGIEVLLEVSYVPKEDLVEVIDKMVKGKLSEDDCKRLSNQYEKADEKEFLAQEMSWLHNVIMGKTEKSHSQGWIVTDDKLGEVLSFMKEHLQYDYLAKNGKVKEITVDSSWPLKNKLDGDEYVLWERLAIEANEVKNSDLLVVNVEDIRLFNHCDMVIQLVKQERSNLSFKGYVLIVAKDFAWKDIKNRACKRDRHQFNYMMDSWYTHIESSMMK